MSPFASPFCVPLLRQHASVTSTGAAKDVVTIPQV